MKITTEQYEMAITHYLDTSDDDEQKTASADAEKRESENPTTWAKVFCEDYGIEIV